VNAVAIAQQASFKTYIANLIRTDDNGFDGDIGRDTGEDTSEDDATDNASERSVPPTSCASSSDPTETESVQPTSPKGSISPFHMAFELWCENSSISPTDYICLRGVRALELGALLRLQHPVNSRLLNAVKSYFQAMSFSWLILWKATPKAELSSSAEIFGPLIGSWGRSHSLSSLSLHTIPFLVLTFIFASQASTSCYCSARNSKSFQL
jgi:hypothetical protein